uniref:Uncharacterized protein n=1 Tax=Siphoviridae sp. ctzpQ31 TaxID=2823613 RepID=A0A8S5L8Q6_9CAUD|nr:MAG TPA: hypothetical protein [Siphoviridae sp. ctzpQ31]DAQ88710.1 MAG TPA: hypothetical protein [Caudoviricetes sp.]DAY03687.1 MAG TPA: hypothetical protein [Bacteriophage sp.]
MISEKVFIIVNFYDGSIDFVGSEIELLILKYREA